MKQTKQRHRVAKCTNKDKLFYDTYGPRKFNGYHAYHSLPSDFVLNSLELGGCVGVEIELAFTKHGSREVFCDTLDSNVIHCSHDGSIAGTEPMELCTIPLLPGDAISESFWKPITNRLVDMSGRSWENATTGLHVHLDRKLFAPKKAYRPLGYAYEITCARAIYGMYVANAHWKKKLFGRVESQQYARNNIPGQILKFVQTYLPEAIHSKTCVEKLIAEAGISIRDRYSEMNCTNTNTIEFRIAKGSLNPNRIASICEFFLLFAKYCRAYHKKISATSQKHFDAFIERHARKNSRLKAIFNPTSEE